MDPKHWQTLEFPRVLEQLASYTAFSAGADKAHNLTPSTLLSEIREVSETTTEARALLESRPQTGLGGVRDVCPQAETARRGATLVPTDLLDIRGTLIAARSLQQTLERLERQFPRLADIAGRIAPCPDLIEAIGHCLDERGEVRDDATPELAQVRRELHTTHDRLQSRLQRLIASPKNAPFLQESIITQREGRYVIPLKANFKGRIRGVIHDRSASGETLFIEPLSVVDLGNSWRELQIQEEQEVHRILAELSVEVAVHSAQIEHTVDALADLDLAFAKAQYAERLEAYPPDLDDGPPHIHFLQARHPLLDPETVVPIDVALDKETHLLIITGPNTGGKTVTLKTVGLLTLMAQSGLHIPAAPGSTLAPFNAIYADIGDEQSIEQSLSTFSSHLTNILSFIDRVDHRSLVLLDELGAGTDPAEGSALARALLETFRQKKTTTFVATHYPELKAYAQLTPGVKNGCVEFDPQTLQPTYRLSIGLPGRSNAFAIARRLGLSEEIARQAEALVSREERQTEDMLADLHQLRLQEAKAREKAHAAQVQAEKQTKELYQQLEQIEQERAALLEAARQEIAEELEQFRQEIQTLRQRLKSTHISLDEATALEAELETLEETAATELAEAQDRVGPESPIVAADLTTHPVLPTRPLRPGDVVWIKPLGVKGELLAVNGENGEVQAGLAHVQVALAQLELQPQTDEEPIVEPSGLTYQVPTPETQIHLRGLTVIDALEQLDQYLDAASLAGLPWVRIVHGRGTGTLRQAVRDFLRTHPMVSRYRPGEKEEGGDGVTVATLL